MCSRIESSFVRAVVLGSCVALAAAVPPTLGGQEPPSQPTEEELVRRIEELRPQLEEARLAAESAAARRRAEAAARPRRPTESLRVGPLRIETVAEQADVAAAVFDEVWREDFHALSGSPALAGTVFAFQWAWSRPEPLALDPAATAGTTVQRVELTRFWVGSRAGVRERVRDAVWAALRRDFPEASALASWLGVTGYPSAERIARAFVLTPAAESRACLSDVLQECYAAFGLAAPDDRVRSVPPGAPAQLLLEAVRLGGEGAWSRAAADPRATPLDALARAAATDPDALIESWRSALLEHRPDGRAGLAATTAATILWVIALGLLAVRSTRWRLA